MRFWPHRRNKELAEEIKAHLAMAERDRIEQGHDRETAERAARRELGNVDLIKEVTRDMWKWRWLERLLQDVRYGMRVLRKSPGYAAVAILSLALGIGVNTAIFSLINAVMLKMLPVRDPQQLVTIGDPARTNGVSHGSSGRTDLFSYPFFERFRERSQVFSDVYASGRSQHLAIAAPDGKEITEQIGKTTGRFVSGNYFAVLGVTALRGRVFADAETRVAGSAPVVVISYGFWQRQFARDEHIVGRKLVVNNSPFTVIGVAPPAFTGDIVGAPIDIWFPLTMQAQANPGYNFLKDSNTEWVLLMGRLKPGVSLTQAAASTNVVAKQIFREQYAKAPADEFRSLLRQTIPVGPGAKGFSRMRRDFAAPLLMLMGVVALVLLICCANVANLQLARAANRSREMNVRLALGAGRGRLLRQLLTESLLLAMAGGVCALAFSHWASRLLLHFVSQNSNAPLDLQLDGRILAFTAAIACFAALLFGLVPAWQSSRTDLVSGLRQTRAGQSSAVSRNFGRMLIVTQVCLSMVLLAGAGLFLRTLVNLQNIDVGYRKTGLVLAELDFTMAGYRGKAVKQLAERLLEALQSAAGVQAVTVSENGLFSGTDSDTTSPIDNYTPHGESDRINHSDRVGPNYFAIVGTAVLAGRGITEQDRENTPKVAVVNESLARFYFGHASPIGRHIFDDPSRKGVVYTIVGVVRDARQSHLRDPARGDFTCLTYKQLIRIRSTQ